VREATKRELEKTPERILVVVIDYDDDLGRAGIETPIVGVKRVLEAAYNYALARPEDSDVNALFAAVKIYRDMEEQGYKVEIAAVSGDQRGGLKAVERLRSQLIDIVSMVGAKAAVIISDGGEDEKIIPVIESIIPIYYVKTVVIEQSRSVEQTYILIWRYIRKILEEPRLSRLAIGYPGFLLVLIGIMALFNLLQQALLIAIIFLGLVMIVRGFNLEDIFITMWKRNPSGTLLTAMGFVVLAIAIMLTILGTVSSYQTYQKDFKVVGGLLENFSWLYGLSIALPLLGAFVRRVLARSIKAWRYGIALTLIVMFSILLRDIGAVLISLPDNSSTRDIVDAMWRSNAFQSLLVIVTAILTASTLLQIAERAIIRSRAKKMR
jgi:putative membrane protein